MRSTNQSFLLHFKRNFLSLNLSATPNTMRRGLDEIEKKQVQKLGPVKTYFTLLKGFVCTGILCLPNASWGGGWMFSIVAFVLSFILTLVCLIQLLKAKKACNGTSFTDVGIKAYGNTGKILVEIFLTLS